MSFAEHWESCQGLGLCVVHRWSPSNQNVAAAVARSDTAVQLFDLEYTQARSHHRTSSV